MIDFRIQSHVLIRKILERSSGKTGNILCDTSRRHRSNRRARGTSRWLDRDVESPDFKTTISSDTVANAEDESEEDALGDDYADCDDPSAPAQVSVNTYSLLTSRSYDNWKKYLTEQTAQW